MPDNKHDVQAEELKEWIKTATIVYAKRVGNGHNKSLEAGVNGMLYVYSHGEYVWHGTNPEFAADAFNKA